MLIPNVLYEFFCSTEGYTVESTAIFTVILLTFVYLIFRTLQFLRIRPDKRLALAISPFVFLGSSLRVLEDAGILTGCLLRTPGIYFMTFTLTFSTILLSKILERKRGIPYYKTTFTLGLILLGPVLGVLRYRNFMGMGYVFIFFFPWVTLLKLIPWLKENRVITGIHVFDGTVTSVSMSFFGYHEQHILPRYFIELVSSPFSFVILKFVIVVSILIILDRYSEGEFKNYIKLIMGILGAATGIRDFFRLSWLV